MAAHFPITFFYMCTWLSVQTWQILKKNTLVGTQEIATLDRPTDFVNHAPSYSWRQPAGDLKIKSLSVALVKCEFKITKSWDPPGTRAAGLLAMRR